MTRTYLRGELYYADLNQCVGSEQEGTAGGCIQNDIGNKHSPTVIAAAITSQNPSKVSSTHCLGAESGLGAPQFLLNSFAPLTSVAGTLYWAVIRNGLRNG